MSDLRERCEDVASMIMDAVERYGNSELIFKNAVVELEAFVKEECKAERIKGMEEVRDEFIRRKRHIGKSMMDIMFLKWVDAEIAKLKERNRSNVES